LWPVHCLYAVLTVGCYATSRAQFEYPGWYWPGLWQYLKQSRLADYFGGYEIHGTENIKDKNAQYFIAIHPHGPVCFSRMFFVGPGGFRELFGRPCRMLAASVLYYLPVIREMTLFFGAVDASKRNVEKLLSKGCNLELYPGGLDEMIQYVPDEVVCKTRTGFLRLALEHGVKVLPVFVFGETSLHSCVKVPGAALIEKLFRVGLVFPVGRFYSFLPFKKPMHLVAGTPIEVVKTPNPSKEQVDALLQEFKAGIQRIFDENKDKYGHSSFKLRFV